MSLTMGAKEPMDRVSRYMMAKTPHLSAISVALVLLVALLVGGVVYARGQERRFVHALAPDMFPLKNKGSALQREAFRQTDLLPVYGSSEVYWTDEHYPYQPYQARVFLAQYPTGFMTFDVADGGLSCLTIAQDLAAVGTELWGRKVVVSFAPTVFWERMAKPDWITAQFSPLHATKLLFSNRIPWDTRKAVAKRLIKYPRIFQNQLLLTLAVRRLTSKSILAPLFYYAILPLGKVQGMVLDLQDHWETLQYIRQRPDLNPNAPHNPRVLDWHALQKQAQNEALLKASNNVFGFDDGLWNCCYRDWVSTQANTLTDKGFTYDLSKSAEWGDLEIALQILRSLGAQPLLLSRPINGVYWQYVGVSKKARKAYYTRLETLARKYNVPVVDFQSHDADQYFSVDPLSHTSRKGWIYVDEILDDFYHDRLP
jgi:D-alanine transfer protein